MATIEIKDGEYTKTIYTMIKEQRYNEAINVLSFIYDSNPSSRAALSLLAYCYYFTQDFVNAANCYEQLTLLYPENEDYRIYYAQALYQACLYEEAMKVTVQIENPELQGKMLKLQAAIKYGEEDLAGAKSLVDQCPADDPDTDINRGELKWLNSSSTVFGISSRLVDARNFWFERAKRAKLNWLERLGPKEELSDEKVDLARFARV